MNKTILLIALGATILSVGLFASIVTQDASAARGGVKGTPWTDTGLPCIDEHGETGTYWRNNSNPNHPLECRT